MIIIQKDLEVYDNITDMSQMIIIKTYENNIKIAAGQGMIKQLVVC